jgi:hypothetical protein
MQPVHGFCRWLRCEFDAIRRWLRAMDDRSAFQGAAALTVVCSVLVAPFVGAIGSGRWWVGTLAAGVLWPSFLWLFHDAASDFADEAEDLDDQADDLDDTAGK